MSAHATPRRLHSSVCPGYAATLPCWIQGNPPPSCGTVIIAFELASAELCVYASADLRCD